MKATATDCIWPFHHQWMHANTTGHIECMHCGETHGHDSPTYKSVVAAWAPPARPQRESGI